MLNRFRTGIPNSHAARWTLEQSVRSGFRKMTAHLGSAATKSDWAARDSRARTRTPAQQDVTRLAMARRAGLIALALVPFAAMLLYDSDSLPRGPIDSTVPLDPRSARIYSTRGHAGITVSELYRRLRETEYVLLGEIHGDPDQHALQHLLLQEILRYGRKPAVVLEMLDRKDAGSISTAIRQSPHDPDPIADAVEWETSGWPDWRLYRPILETALDADLQIAAGNVSRAELLQVVFGNGWEALGQRTLRSYGLLEPLPSTQEQALRKLLLHAHGGDLSPQVVDRMLKAQRLRDASLAETMLAHNQGAGAVLIAGREHARQDYGVSHYLRYREPDATIASVAFIGADDRHPSAIAQAGSLAFDYLWLLPGSRTPIVDVTIPADAGSSNIGANRVETSSAPGPVDQPRSPLRGSVTAQTWHTDRSVSAD